MSGIAYRPLQGLAEFKAAEALQRTVWGEGDKEDPFDLMMVIQNEGGLVGGAFREGHLLGFVFGFPTRDPSVQYSHRLAVLPEARGLGLGIGLKRYQRQWCLDQGIRQIRWTYDPLRLPNAALNIRGLGGRASTYYCDFYGEMEGINKGAPSDRVRVDWLLDDPVVAHRVAGNREPVALGGSETLEIAIPGNFDQILADDPEEATRIRFESRAVFQRAFADGFTIRDFNSRKLVYILAKAATAD